MPQWLMIFQVLMPLLAQLPSLVAVAERAFSKSDTKQGAAKKELVLSTVRTGLDTAGALGVEAVKSPEAKAIVLHATGELVEAIVAGYNAAQVFTRRAEEPQS